MSNDSKSRRWFLGAAAMVSVGGSVAALTPREGTASSEEPVEQETNISENETVVTETSTTRDDNSENVERALKATAFNLYDDLSMRGFDRGAVQLVDVEAPEDSGENYQLDICVDLNSIYHTSGMTVRDQDLHTAGELGLVKEVLEGADTMYTMASMIQDNLDDFYSEVGRTEGSRVDVEVDIRGARDSGYSFFADSLETSVVDETKKFMESPEKVGRHSFHPMEYDPLMLLEQGESTTITHDDTEHTIEYVKDGFFRLNGKIQERAQNEKLGRFDGEDVYVESINPLHVQENYDTPDAVELRFESLNPEYR